MKNQLILKRKWNGIFLFVFSAVLFFSCENHRFDSDKRQIIAKDQILKKLVKVNSFDVTGFNEDTVNIEGDSDFKKQIRYALDFTFVDSNKIFQKKKGIVMFTPDGTTMINSKITGQ